MKLTKIFLVIILGIPFLAQAQYTGGIGRGDVSFALTNILLPIGEAANKVQPEYFLEQNSPNPFNPATIIKYGTPERNQIKLSVYDVLGNEIAILVDEEKPAGTYQVTWNAANLPSGAYFYRIEAGEFIQTKKIILLR